MRLLRERMGGVKGAAGARRLGRAAPSRKDGYQGPTLCSLPSFFLPPGVGKPLQAVLFGSTQYPLLGMQSWPGAQLFSETVSVLNSGAVGPVPSRAVGKLTRRQRN